MSPRLRIFFALLPKKPAKALAIVWWWVTGRRVRAWSHLRIAAADFPNIYSLWLSVHQPVFSPLQNVVPLPPIAVHVHFADKQEASVCIAAIASVRKQSFPHWSLYITSTFDSALEPLGDPRIHVLSTGFVNRTTALAHVLQVVDEAYLVPLTVDCVLDPQALHVFAQALDPEQPAVLYADQDEVGPSGQRCNPWFKPGWDQDLFLAQDFLSLACALPVEPARCVEWTYDGPDALAVHTLLAGLLIGPQATLVRHVPHVAVSTPAHAWCSVIPGRVELVGAITGLPVSAGPFGTVTVHHPLPDPLPRVSVIIPTRDRLDLLETSVSGVLHNTNYPAIELIIVDNDSVEAETLAFLTQCARDPRVKIERWAHPYNYSAINNFAVTRAGGPYICLLNNDTEVVDPEWLREMIVHAVRSDVGAVGARLLYPDHSIQHAGVVVGMGNAAGHAHRGLQHGEPGYFAQAVVAREATAVTAACLIVAKDRYEMVGGLDETGLAIAYNDVDLCLKLRAKGWRNIYVPQAVMIHHESKSRGADFAHENLARYKRELAIFQRRWDPSSFVDPTHHRALDKSSEEYRLII